MLTNEQYKAIDKQAKINPVNIVISREGAGKSSYAAYCVKTLRNVIFLCFSNKQAEEQSIRFQESGFKTQLVKSKSAKLKELGYEVVMTETDYGLSPGRIDIKATLNKYPAHRHAEVNAVIDSVEPDQFNLTGEYQIICSTFHQRSQIQGFNGEGWVVVFDDPTKQDVSRFVKLPSHYKLENVDPEFKVQRRAIIEGFPEMTYIERPARLDLTFNLHIPVVITSTEELISQMASNNLAAKLLDYREFQDAGDIRFISSPLVRKDRDFLLALFAKHLNLELIGDAIPGSVNKHISTKGANSLKSTSTLVEISAPHPNLLMELMLEFPALTQEEIRIKHMLDVTHQAIGRNQGNRFNGAVCYLLVEPQNAPRLSEQLQYKHKYFANTDDIFYYLNDLWFTHKKKDYIMSEIQRLTKYPMQLIGYVGSNGKYKLIELMEAIDMSTDAMGEVLMRLGSHFTDEQVGDLCKAITSLMNKGRKITND